MPLHVHLNERPLAPEHAQPADDPLRAAAEREAPTVERTLLAAFSAARSLIGYRQPLARVLAELPSMLLPATFALERSYRAGALSIPLEPFEKLTINFSFDRVQPSTQAIADASAARFVREIGEDVRTTLSGVIQDSTRSGWSIDRTTRALKDSVGLTAQQSRAVENYRRMLEGRSDEVFDRALRDKRFDRSVEEHIAGRITMSPERIDRQVEAYRRRYIAYRAQVIARSETLFASNHGAVTAMRASVAEGWLKPEQVRKHWLVAHNERVCPICRSIVQLQPNGVPLDQPFQWRTKSSSGEVDCPVAHPLCFPGYARVTASPRIEAASKRWFEGELWVIDTAAGKQLPTTSEHPVLTRHGWKLARDVHEGDDLVRRIGLPGGASAIHHDNDHVPTSIGELANAVLFSQAPSRFEMPHAAPYFDRYGLDSEIETVDAYRLLHLGLNAAQLEISPDFELTSADIGRLKLASLSASFFALDRLNSALYGGMGRGGLQTALFYSHGLPTELELLGRGAPQSQSSKAVGDDGTADAERICKLFDRRSSGITSDQVWQIKQQARGLSSWPRRAGYTDFAEATVEGGAADAILFRELVNGCSGQIAFDRVVKVRQDKFSGHVYNLQTSGRHYTVDDLIVHNCRCSTTFSIGNRRYALAA